MNKTCESCGGPLSVGKTFDPRTSAPTTKTVNPCQFCSEPTT